ncbi:MAG: glycosyltransferase family 4 protein [Nanoarchaeota archaeon]
MKLLVLTSRYTANRDIIGEDFGRQTRLFSALKKLGHEIDFYVADYRKLENKDLRLHGINVKIRAFSVLNFFSFLMSLNHILKCKKYDAVIASSDPLWGIIGYIFAKRHNVRFIYDLHDNYETYASYQIPFFKYIDNFVLTKADLVTAVSHSLRNKVMPIREKKVFVVQNGFEAGIFKPKDRLKCRKELKLPINAKIIAYAGSIQRVQGIDLLVDMFNDLKNKIKNLKLAIAGRFVKGEEKYINLDYGGIIYLKSLGQDKVAELINAADVVVVPNPANAFTKYCFPYKVVEYMACNVPIVATNVGDTGLFLSKFKDSVCKENDEKDIAEKIKIQLGKGRVSYRKDAMKNTWENIASRFDKVLKENIR